MTHVLITGGAGFIGSHLTDALIQRGHQVTLLDVLDPQVHGAHRQPPPYLNPAAHLVVGDVRDFELVKRLLDEAQVIFHLAAFTGVGQSMYRIRDYLEVNVQGTAVLLEAIIQGPRRIEKLILASSRAIYGEGAYHCLACGLVTPAARSPERLAQGLWEVPCPRCGAQVSPIPTPETLPPQPGSMYAVSKLAQEQACMVAGQAYRLPVVVLRYFNVYGPRQSLRNPYTGVITTFINRLANGEAPEVYEDGLESRDFVHVADVTRANLLAMENEAAAGQVFNVGSGQRITLLEVAQAVSQALGGPQPQITGKYRVGDIRHCFADLTHIKKTLGFQPTITFAEGIPTLAQQAAAEVDQDLSAQAEAELQAHGLASRAGHET